MIARLAVVIAAVAITGGIVVYVRSTRDDDFPDAWDPRVQDLVDFVEDERGHDFDHPVPVDFLTDEEYSEQTRADNDDLDEAALEELEQAEGLLRAFGLVSGDVDLVEAGNDLSDTGTLAFYDPSVERVIVRGTEVDPGLAVTLVHELTHVLQDQVFGIGALADPDATSGESFAFRALVEGDARRIEAIYADEELSDDELAAIDDATEEDLDSLDDEGIPEALQAIFALPYFLGEPFIAYLEADGGDDAIDDAFEEPPTTEEHLAVPPTFVDDDEAADVEVPAADDGAEVLDEGDFGAASLYLVLTQRIDVAQALAASDGWGGDAYVSFERDGVTCAVLDLVGDTAADADELEVALADWATAGPEGSASASRDDDVVRLETCDPGVDAPVASGSPLDAATVLATRSFFAASTLDQGADEEFAWCYANGVVTGFTLEELSAEELPADFEARLQPIAVGCQ